MIALINLDGLDINSTFTAQRAAILAAERRAWAEE